MLDVINVCAYSMHIYSQLFSVLIALSLCAACAEPPPPPTKEEWQSMYEKELPRALRDCLLDYPNEEILLMEQGWTYEGCARSRAALRVELNLKYNFAH